MADTKKIAEIRQEFFNKYNGEVDKGVFDPRDIARFRATEGTDKDYTDGFLRSTLKAPKVQGDVKKAVEYLHTALKWRKDFGLNDIKEEDLLPELRQKAGVYYKGRDRDGHKILLFQVCKSDRGKLVAETNRYVAHYMAKHHNEDAEHGLVLLFDFTNAGVGNMDLDMTRFIVDSAALYFPGLFEYSLMFKMSKVLEGVWRIVSKWLDPYQAQHTYFVKRADIQKYVEASELEPWMIRDPAKKK